MSYGRSMYVLALVLVAAVVALLAGCGGSEESSDPLSRAEYLKQGNQICKKGGIEKDKAVKRGLEEIPPNEITSSLSEKRLKKLSEGVLPYFQKTVTELAELQPPAKDKASVEKFIGELEAVSAKAEANPVLIAKRDPFSEAAANARDYGLKACVL